MLLKLQLRTWVTRIAQVLLRDSYTVGARDFFLGGGKLAWTVGPMNHVSYTSLDPPTGTGALGGTCT